MNTTHATDEAPHSAHRLSGDLQEIVRFYRDLLNSLSSYIAVLDSNGIIVESNKSWRNFAFDTSEETAVNSDVGKQYLDVCWACMCGVDKEWADDAARGIHTVLEKDLREFTLEYPLHSPLEQRWFVLRATLLKESSDHAVVVSHTDITDRKLAEIEINYARAYAESIVETLHEPLVVIMSPEMKVVSANDCFYETFKVTPEETIGNSIYDLGNRQWDIPRLKALLEDILPHDSVVKNYEVQHDFVNIGRRTFMLNARQFFTNKPDSQKILLAMDDITVRKQREADALQESKEDFHQLVENLSAGVVVHNSDSAIIFSNPMAAALLGLSNDQMRGKTAMDPSWCFLHVDGTTAPLEEYPINRVLSSGQPVTNQILGIKRPDLAEPLWVQCNAYPFTGPDGAIIHVVVTFTDISELKRAELEITRLNSKLEQRVIERTAQLERARNEMESFAYSVSHDLRAPLRSIDGFSLALLEEYGNALEDVGKDYLRRVRAATQRMAQLIDDMLKLSRITRAELIFEKVNLSHLAVTVSEELRSEEPERNVTFVIAPGVTAKGDPRLLKVVLDNLLGNAWKFTSNHAEARIEFGVTTVGAKTTYFVRDDGAGFNMKYAGKLFTTFQRLHTEQEFVGTGVGLALVQHVIQRHGGRVWAEGAVEQGATFWFTLGGGGGVRL